MSTIAASSLSLTGDQKFNVVPDGPRKTISQIKTDSTLTKVDTITTRATITSVKKEPLFYYLACPKADCNKKVVETSSSSGTKYHCERCKHEYENCDYRYILNLTANDHTGSQWLSSFNDTGEALLGIKAQELVQLKNQNQAAFDSTFQNIAFKTYLLKLRCKIETYNADQKLKCTLIAFTALNFVTESQVLLKEIKALASM